MFQLPKVISGQASTAVSGQLRYILVRAHVHMLVYPDADEMENQIMERNQTVPKNEGNQEVSNGDLCL